MSNQKQTERIKELIYILWNWSKGYRQCGIATIEKAIDELKQYSEHSHGLSPRTVVNVEGLGAIESGMDFLRAIETLKSYYLKTARFKIGDWVIKTDVRSPFRPGLGYTPIIGTVKKIDCSFNSQSVNIVYTIAQVHKNKEVSTDTKITQDNLLYFDPEQIANLPSKKIIYQGWLIKAMALGGNVFKFKGQPKFLVEQIKEDIEAYGSLLSVCFFANDQEITTEEFQKLIAESQSITGIVDIDFENSYNEDGNEYTEETFKVGSTNILKELENAIGEYVAIEIICDF